MVDLAEEFIKLNKRDAILINKCYSSSDSLSYFGGRPRCPRGFKWPKNTRTKRSMPFLGQLDLGQISEIIPSELPKDGILYFFRDESLEVGPDTGGECVLYAPHKEALIEFPTPEDVPPVRHGRNGSYGHINYIALKEYPRYEIVFSDFYDIKSPYTDRNLSDEDILRVREISNKQVTDAIRKCFPSEFERRTKKSWTNYDHYRILDPDSVTKNPSDRQDKRISPLLIDWPQTGFFIVAHLHKFVNEEEYEYKRLADGATKDIFVSECRNWIELAKKYGLFTALPEGIRDAYRLWVSSKYINSYNEWKKSGNKDNTLYGIYHGLDNYLRFSALDSASYCADADRFKDSLLSCDALADFENQLTPERNHQMLGVGYKEFRGKGNDMVLLLQLGSDYSMRWMFHDVGILQFWISKEDLKSLRFENVVAIMDGC